MTMTRTFAGAALLLASLSACSRSEPEAPVVENQVTELPKAEEPAPVPQEVPVAPEPSVAPTDANLVADVPPEVAPEPDEQMLDDASATGMTARTSRGEQPADGEPATEVQETR